MAECDILGLESISEGKIFVNTNNGVETQVLPKVFGSIDLFEMKIDMPSLESSPYVSATSPPSFPYVVTAAP